MSIDNNNDGGIPQSDEVLSEAPQTLAPSEVSKVHVIDAPAVTDEPQAIDPVVTAAPAEANAEEPEFNFAPPEPTNNAVQEKDIYLPLDAPWDDLNVTLNLPPDTHARTLNYLGMQPNVDITQTEEGALWREGVEAGLNVGSFMDSSLDSAKRSDAAWRQVIRHGSKNLEAARPKIGDDGPLLKGERGILRMNALLGRGSIVSIPLWHSGFWITLKAPKESQLLDMHQRMAEEKIKFGRITHGLAFANYTVFTADALVSLVMECVYETSIKDLESATELRKMIKSLDLNTLAWGLATVIWPRGFQYSRSLLDEQGLKTNTVEGKLNVGSLLWADSSALDEWQVAHMGSRATGSMSKDSIKNYQEHFVRGKPKAYALNEQISMTLRVPNLDEFLNAGTLWVNETVASVNAAFTQETSSVQRNKLITERGKATSLRQYVHWIESIDFPTIDKQMKDDATIGDACSSLSGDDAIREVYYKVMREYINDSTIAIIATPLANEEEKKQTNERFPWLLPIDPISTFFTLLSQKVAQIQLRP